MTEEYFFARWRGHTPGLLGARYACAVLVPVLCLPGREPSLLYEVRAGTLRRQPGEVCFPGGKVEPGETAVRGALREAEEELGIPAGAVDVVGELDFICHQSGFLIHPILGRLTDWTPEKARLNPAEVAEIFTVPLSFLEKNPPQVWRYPLKPEPPADFPYDRLGVRRDYPWRSGSIEIPVYVYEGHTIWGLTARITKSLMDPDE